MARNYDLSKFDDSGFIDFSGKPDRIQEDYELLRNKLNFAKYHNPFYTFTSKNLSDSFLYFLGKPECKYFKEAFGLYFQSFYKEPRRCQFKGPLITEFKAGQPGKEAISEYRQKYGIKDNEPIIVLPEKDENEEDLEECLLEEELSLDPDLPVRKDDSPAFHRAIAKIIDEVLSIKFGRYLKKYVTDKRAMQSIKVKTAELKPYLPEGRSFTRRINALIESDVLKRIYRGKFTLNLAKAWDEEDLKRFLSDRGYA